MIDIIFKIWFSINRKLRVDFNEKICTTIYYFKQDVINGKLVLGDRKEIQEVKNAYKTYEMMKESKA